MIAAAAEQPLQMGWKRRLLLLPLEQVVVRVLNLDEEGSLTGYVECFLGLPLHAFWRVLQLVNQMRVAAVVAEDPVHAFSGGPGIRQVAVASCCRIVFTSLESGLEVLDVGGGELDESPVGGALLGRVGEGLAPHHYEAEHWLFRGGAQDQVEALDIFCAVRLLLVNFWSVKEEYLSSFLHITSHHNTMDIDYIVSYVVARVERLIIVMLLPEFQLWVWPSLRSIASPYFLLPDYEHIHFQFHPCKVVECGNKREDQVDMSDADAIKIVYLETRVYASMSLETAPLLVLSGFILLKSHNYKNAIFPFC